MTPASGIEIPCANPVGGLLHDRHNPLTLHSSKTINGRFVQADADSLTLRAEGNTTSKINKEEILRIHRKSAALGAFIDAGMAGRAGVGGPRGRHEQAATAGIGSVLRGLGGEPSVL